MNKFEEKIRPVLGYIGFIGAAIMSIAYLFIVVVMINGFKAQTGTSTVLFAAVNAIVGLIISNFLKFQGVTLAQSLPENRAIEKSYYSTKTKDKKAHSMTYFWFTTVIKDVLVKGLSFVVATTGIIYIVIEGSKDWNLLLLAGVNLMMFICFGLLALNKGYDYYQNTFVPFMKERMEESINENESGTDSSVST